MNAKLSTSLGGRFKMCLALLHRRDVSRRPRPLSRDLSGSKTGRCLRSTSAQLSAWRVRFSARSLSTRRATAMSPARSRVR